MFDVLGGTLPAPDPGPGDACPTIAQGRVVPVIVVGLIVGAVVWGRIKHKERVRDVVDPLKLKVPVFGPLSRRSRSPASPATSAR